MMRHAYLVDPFTQTVTQVFITSPIDSAAELAEIYALLGCTDIERVTLHTKSGDVLLVDERGKVRETEHAYFECTLYPHATLAGRALWVGTTRDGVIESPACILEYVRDHVIWLATDSQE